MKIRAFVDPTGKHHVMILNKTELMLADLGSHTICNLLVVYVADMSA